MGLEGVKAQIATARIQIKQKRADILRTKEQLERAKKGLPSRTSQQALRKQYSGLQGREYRRKILGAEQKIGSRIKDVKGYETDIRTYEREQIEPVEAQVAHYEHQQSAFETAKKLHQSGHIFPLNYIDDSLVRGYLAEMRQDQRFAQESFQRQIGEIEATLPEGEKLVVDFKNMRIEGVESAGLGQSFSVEQYNLKVDEFNRDLTTMPEIKDIQLSTTRLNDRTNQIKTNAKITGLGVIDSLFPSVSAKALSSSTALDNYGYISNRSSVGNLPSKNLSIPSRVDNLGDNRTGVGKFLLGIKEGFQGSVTGLAIASPEIPVVTASTIYGQASPTLVGFQTPGEFAKIERAGISSEKFRQTLIGQYDPLGREGLGKNVRAPTTKLDLFLQERRGADLPYGLESTPERVSGQEFSPFFAHMYIGRLVGETPLGKRVSQRVDPTGKIGRTFGPIVAELPKALFFAPAFSTGAAVKGKTTTQKQITKTRFSDLGKELEKEGSKRISKADVELDLRFKKEGNVLKEKTTYEKVQDFKKIVEDLKDKTPKERLQAKKFLEDTYGKEEFNKIAKEFLAQEGFSATPTQVRTAPTDIIIDIQGNLRNIPRVDILTATTTKKDISPNVLTIDKQKSILEVEDFVTLDSKPKQAQVNILGLKTPQITRQLTAQTTQQLQQPKFDLGLKQTTTQTTAQAPALKLLETLKTSQKSKTQQVFKQTTKKKTKTTSPIKVPLGSPAQKAVKTLIGGTGFKIFARKGGEDIEIGETQTLGGAKELLTKKLKSGLQASGFIKRKGGEKLSFAELGGLGPEFRISKKDLFRVVELKQKRLRKATTGKDIQFFRKQKKNKGLFN